MLSLWLRWELRAMVVLSLTVQLILIKYGNRRKFSGKYSKLKSFLVWAMYLFADWFATLALSTLLRTSKEQITSSLVIFWTPFLLLHLGGPDTITAYSMSDNELWPRHFFGLCFQIGVAVYVYVKFWTITVTTLNFLAIPIFIVGITKYAERVCALFMASSTQLRKSVFPVIKSFQFEPIQPLVPQSDRNEMSLEVFKPLFSDLKLRIFKELHYIFQMKSRDVTAEDAFKMVEIELGFLYNQLYTKIRIVVSRTGVILRCICLSLTVSTLTAFLIIVGKHGYSKVDIGISYLLMVGAIFLEIYSDILHLSSDYGILWLTSQNNWFFKLIGSKLFPFTEANKGIRSMAQHSLLGYCLNPKKNMLTAVLNTFDTEENLEKYFHTSWKDVIPGLKEIIYSHLLEKRKKYEEAEFSFDGLSGILDDSGYKVLLQKGYVKDFDWSDINWSVFEVEFTHRLLIWHIATDLVLYDDHRKYRAGTLGPYCQFSKLLSDYMMYLLFLCPAMLPEGIGNIRHRDTCIEARNFLNGKSNSWEAIGILIETSDIESKSFFVEMGSLRKSALFEGCQIANRLKQLANNFRLDHKEKWEIVGQVWLNMLTYAASQCSWKEHSAQLQHGEELLTHVALLMAHLGLTKQIHLAEMPNRLKDVNFRPTWDWDRLEYRLAYYLA
ncbi:hypothetical protein DITRI_Ditri13aG0161900 [Diplodiscus trichospermus]